MPAALRSVEEEEEEDGVVCACVCAWCGCCRCGSGVRGREGEEYKAELKQRMAEAYASRAEV
eukprot:2221841-Rhodomonas_salina.1